MKTRVAIACAIVSVALAGCAAHLEKRATNDLEAQGAEIGMQFVKAESKQTEAVVMSSATVSGECVGPADPRFVTPASPPEG